MPLSLVAEVTRHGGFLPQLAQLDAPKRKFLTRRNGLGFSLIWAIFWLLIMAPFWGIVDVEELAGISAVIGIFGGLIMMLSSFIFLKTDKVPQFMYPNYMQPPRDLGSPHHGYAALPPQQSVPASVYGPPQAGNWRDTNDLQPASVTESTTKLLEKDEQLR